MGSKQAINREQEGEIIAKDQDIFCGVFYKKFRKNCRSFSQNEMCGLMFEEYLDCMNIIQNSHIDRSPYGHHIRYRWGLDINGKNLFEKGMDKGHK